MEQSPRHEVPYEDLATVAATCKQVVEIADQQHGCVEVTGVIDPGDEWHADSTSCTEEEVRRVLPTTVYGIRQCISLEGDLREKFHIEPADGYSFGDRSVSLPNGWLGVQTIHSEANTKDPDEFVTVTTIVLPSDGEESLHVRILTKDGEVAYAEMFGVAADYQAVCLQCYETFGGDSAVYRLLEGEFEGSEMLVQILDEASRSMLGNYAISPDDRLRLIALLSNIYEIGISLHGDRSVRNGIKPERVARLHAFTQMLTAV